MNKHWEEARRQAAENQAQRDAMTPEAMSKNTKKNIIIACGIIVACGIVILICFIGWGAVQAVL